MLSRVKFKLKFKFEIDILVETEIVDVGGRGFVEVKEFGVPDMVKSMSWCGENICLGIRREYVILNASNGALSEVFTSGRLAPPLVVPIPSGELLLGKVLFSSLNVYVCIFVCCVCVCVCDFLFSLLVFVRLEDVV
jgi:hypothetical protein